MNDSSDKTNDRPFQTFRANSAEDLFSIVKDIDPVTNDVLEDFSASTERQPVPLEIPGSTNEPASSAPVPSQEVNSSAFIGTLPHEEVPFVSPENHKPIIFSEEHPLELNRNRVISEETEKSRFPKKQDPVVLSRSMFSDDSTLGDFLLEARKAAGMTIAQVEQFTRIRTDYIDALEHNDLKKLHAPVFISAYIRSLCSLYNLDQGAVDFANEKLKALSVPSDVPEKLIQELESDCLVNEAEEKRVRKILYVAGVLGLLLVIAISWGVTVAVLSSRTPKNIGSVTVRTEKVPDNTALQSPLLIPGASFDSKSLEQLKAPQIPTMRTLEMRKN